MPFDNEIERAVKHLFANDRDKNKKKEELEDIIASVKTAVANIEYNFAKSESIVLSQDKKKRFVKQFKDLYSVENILCQCIKQMLDRALKVKYPNRNKSVRALFDVLTAVKQMSDFTIVRFDFKDYFNSVSAVYVFEKFIKPKLSDRFEIDIIGEFSKKTRFAYAGFCSSNVIAEIIAKHFDEYLKLAFIDKGIIFYERYIDDAVIIFNEHVEKSNCLDKLHETLESIFRDKSFDVLPKCKTKFNSNKFKYISRRNIGVNTVSFDYLGYEFWLNVKNTEIQIKYGITKEKRDKYNKRLSKLIMCYTDIHHKDYNNLELLRHRISVFSTRTVYRNKKFKSDVWKAKGFIRNYGELRYLLDTGLIEDETTIFLKTMIEEGFNSISLPLPYFMKGSKDTAGYNLFENMKINKTLLLVKHIGYDYYSLVKLCAQIGKKNTDKDGKKRGYGTLVRDYLIETKVGY